MLHFATDVKIQDVPKGIDDFLRDMQERLGSEWTVRLIAFDDEIPDNPNYISVSFEAKSKNEIIAQMSRQHGSHTCFVSFLDRESVPIEDLAVVLGKLDIDEVLLRIKNMNVEDASCPMMNFDEVLAFLRDNRLALRDALHPDNRKMSSKLRKVADEIVRSTPFLNSE